MTVDQPKMLMPALRALVASPSRTSPSAFATYGTIGAGSSSKPNQSMRSHLCGSRISGSLEKVRAVLAGELVSRSGRIMRLFKCAELLAWADASKRLYEPATREAQRLLPDLEYTG